MGEALMGWREKVWEFLKDEPVYAPSPESKAEGWKVAYEQQKNRAVLAERKLARLKGMSDSMIKRGWGTDYAYMIRDTLNMTEEELDGD